MASLEDLEATAETVQSPKTKKKRKPIDIDAPHRDYPFSEWKKEITENFPELWMATEACASVVAQLLIHDVHNPFCLILLDAPASGKTITLNFFKEIEKLVEFCDDFTPASFVTGVAGKSEEKLKEIDLLPRIRNRVLAIPEMASIMSDSEDELRRRLGVLTRVLDGEGLKMNTGVHGARGYSGDYSFMMLGASTPFPLRVWKAMTGFGHRLFFLNLGTSDPDEDQLLRQLAGEGHKWLEQRCQLATEGFIKTLWTKNKDGITWNKKKDDKDALLRIVRLASFQAVFRGDIIIYEEKYTQGKEISHTKPTIEKPHRVNQCLYNLARGHAVLHGRDYITMDDVDIPFKVVMSTAPSPRPDLVRCLVAHGGTVVVSDVIKDMNIVRNTAKKEMTKLEMIGLVDITGKDTNDTDDALPFVKQAKWEMKIKKKFEWILEA